MSNRTPNCQHEKRTPIENTIGYIFRQYGEKYIQSYSCSQDAIKLIRAIRKCRTAAMGGLQLKCKECGKSKIIYKSCGNAKCPICQSIKRHQCQDRIGAKMLAVPYVHLTFTLPHQLNPLLRFNKKLLYSLLYKSSWLAVKEVASNPKNIGGLPGMIALMHSWGSDMKYHVHLHTLVTFGGLDEEGNFHFPKRKDKISRYRTLRASFRKNYLLGLEKLILQNKLELGLVKSDELLEELWEINWVIHCTIPTVNTKVIEEYLTRYIMRIAVSNTRLNYDQIHHQVQLIYNDYRNQIEGEKAPKKIKVFDPISFIHQFLQHLPPRYFQRLRYYGLHASATFQKCKDKIPDRLKRKGETIRTLFQILKALLTKEMLQCEECSGCEFDRLPILIDEAYLKNTVPGYQERGPPKRLITLIEPPAVFSAINSPAEPAGVCLESSKTSQKYPKSAF